MANPICCVSYVIYHFIRQHPTGQVYIYDIDLARTLKKWGEGAWYGLPANEAVYSDPEDFPRIVRTIAGTIKQSGDDSPILLVVDEFNPATGQLDAPGLGNNPSTVQADQQRRVHELMPQLNSQP